MTGQRFSVRAMWFGEGATQMSKQTWFKVGAGGYGAATWLVIWLVLGWLRAWPHWLNVILAFLIILGSNWVLRWVPQHSLAHDYWAVGFIGCTGLFILLT
jgi:hypothetical protein